MFGIETSVKVTARAQAGASASAKALVTIGNDGKIHFKVGAGATVGIGGGVDLEFSISIEALLKHLGIKSLTELIEWCELFVKDPAAFIAQLIEDAQEKIPGMLVAKATEVITDTVTSAYETAQKILTSFTTNPFTPFLPPIGGPPGIGSAGGGMPPGGGMGGAPSSGPLPEYKRAKQLRTWSE